MLVYQHGLKRSHYVSWNILSFRFLKTPKKTQISTIIWTQSDTLVPGLTEQIKLKKASGLLQQVGISLFSTGEAINQITTTGMNIFYIIVQVGEDYGTITWPRTMTTLSAKNHRLVRFLLFRNKLSRRESHKNQTILRNNHSTVNIYDRTNRNDYNATCWS